MNRTRDRLTSVTVAVLLQMGFVAIFIYSLPLIAPPKKLVREMTFFLPRLRVQVLSPARRQSRVTRPKLQHAVLFFRRDGPLVFHCCQLRESLS